MMLCRGSVGKGNHKFILRYRTKLSAGYGYIPNILDILCTQIYFLVPFHSVVPQYIFVVLFIIMNTLLPEVRRQNSCKWAGRSLTGTARPRQSLPEDVGCLWSFRCSFDTSVRWVNTDSEYGGKSQRFEFRFQQVFNISAMLQCKLTVCAVCPNPIVPGVPQVVHI